MISSGALSIDDQDKCSSSSINRSNISRKFFRFAENSSCWAGGQVVRREEISLEIPSFASCLARTEKLYDSA